MDEIVSTVNTLADEEREKFDNMPEGLQAGDKGQAIQEAADTLESAVSDMDDAINGVENAIANIEMAMQ
jgi:hypothetical protein